MPLSPGTKLGSYEILASLGAGGMGEVYKATDTRLDRIVAIKVLPAHLSQDPERRKRFEREAKAVAALNHPNIVTVYSIEETEGIHFITMELVRGKTLTEAIPNGGLALSKFFETAVPIADAVSAAHQQGITHRDLKPDNVMVSDEGRVKILDFGLAKLKLELSPVTFGSELPTESMTQEGRILGTVAYMSPEQAEGKTVDHRSDIFSLGIIFYEMATGQRPFQGDTTASILSSIIKDTPASVTELSPELPRDLGKLVRRCLVKNPEDRLQSAKDLRNELRELKQEVDSGGGGEDAVTATSSGISKRLLLVAVVAAVLFSVVASYLALRPRGESEQTAVGLMEGKFAKLTSQPGLEQFPSLSPDGRFVAYEALVDGNWDVYLQRVGGENPMNLTKDGTSGNPSFSPDGDRIAFMSFRDDGRGIFVMGATGESVRRLTDFGYNPAWSPDGEEIVFATANINLPYGRGSPSQLWAVSVANGEKRLITEGDAVQPSWSPHGHRIAYWGLPVGGSQRDIWTVPAGGGEAVSVTNDAAVDWSPVWSPDGKHLYFCSDRGGAMNLWRVPIDEASGEVLGEPEPLTTPSPLAGHLSISRDSPRMAYASVLLSSNVQRIEFDPSTETVVSEPIAITRGSRYVRFPDLSPDGEWLVLPSSPASSDILIIRTDGTGRRQLTDDVYQNRYPRWSPDGKRIAFFSDRSGSSEIWTIHPDGAGLQRLTETPGVNLWSPVWSPDGSRMVTFAQDDTSYIFDPRIAWKEQTPLALPPLSDGGEAFQAMSWSPDGKRLAGAIRRRDWGIAVYSLESQKYEKLTDFGLDPVWLSDSRRLLFGSRGMIFLLDSVSKQYNELISVSEGVAQYPSISKDDRTIYFTIELVESDIWLLDLKDDR